MEEVAAAYPDAVSYTHLDVYKRQRQTRTDMGRQDISFCFFRIHFSNEEKSPEPDRKKNLFS